MNNNYFTPIDTRPTPCETIFDPTHRGFYFIRGTKRTAPEATPVPQFNHPTIPISRLQTIPRADEGTKRARTSNINMIRDCILVASSSLKPPSPPPPLEPKPKCSTQLDSSQIVVRFRSFLEEESTLQQINNGTITLSSIIDDSVYTFFETAILLKEWELAIKILLNDPSSEISLRSKTGLISEFNILLLAANEHQWGFIKCFLSRNLKRIDADCLSCSEAIPIITRVNLVFADHFSCIIHPSDFDKAKFFFKFFVELVVFARKDSILKKLIENYVNVDAEFWKDPLFFLIQKRAWPYAQMILIAHPQLASVPLSLSPYPPEDKNYPTNATILWLLCYLNQASIIRSIMGSIDFSLFFKTNSRDFLHSETTPFALLVLYKQKNIVSSLLDANSEDKSYDVMRGQKFPYEISILSYAIEFRKWNLAHFILEYYYKANKEFKGIYELLKDFECQMKIFTYCPNSLLKDNLLDFCHYFLGKFVESHSQPARPIERSSSADFSQRREVDEWDRELRSIIEA